LCARAQKKTEPNCQKKKKERWSGGLSRLRAAATCLELREGAGVGSPRSASTWNRDSSGCGMAEVMVAAALQAAWLVSDAVVDE